jgi:hypothetical protein
MNVPLLAYGSVTWQITYSSRDCNTRYGIVDSMRCCTVSLVTFGGVWNSLLACDVEQSRLKMFWKDLKQVIYGYYNHNIYIVSAKMSNKRVEPVIYPPTERCYSTILATFQEIQPCFRTQRIISVVIEILQG